MAIILNIETATKNCSVSIAKDGIVLGVWEVNDGKYSHAEKLHPFIHEVLKNSEIEFNQIDAIAVSKGPGSYTGLRIGVSAAKGLCFALNKPLISLETLEVLATSLAIEDGYIVPMIDARRMEVYSAVYESNYTRKRIIQAEVIDESSFQDVLSEKTTYFLGDGAEKCKSILSHKNAIFVDGKHPSAKEMASLSFAKFKQNLFEDVAYFEPFYLKNFVATPEKKK